MNITGYTPTTIRNTIRSKQHSPLSENISARGWYPLERQVLQFGAGLVNTANLLAAQACPTDCIAVAVRAAADLLRLPYSAFLSLQPGGIFTLEAEFQRSGENCFFPGHSQLSSAQLVYHRALRQKEPLLISRAAQSSRLAESQALGLESGHSACLLPVRAGERPVGILVCGGQAPMGGQSTLDINLQHAETLASLIGSRLANGGLVQSDEDQPQTVLATLEMLLTAGDVEVRQHCANMVALIERMAAALQLNDEERKVLVWATMLHDLGKLAIPADILHRPGPLSGEEWVRMKRHPLVGAELLDNDPSLAAVSIVVRGHHENFDGSGYPDGLRGEEIPLGARVLSIVDSYTAMTEYRVYQPPRTQEQAVAELQRCSNRKYDPDLLAIFLRVLDDPAS